MIFVYLTLYIADLPLVSVNNLNIVVICLKISVRLQLLSFMSFSDSQGAVIVSTENNVYGNNVTLRNNVLGFAGKKSWVDAETLLPGGTLEKFFFYIHPLGDVMQDLPITVIPVHLQVWRRMDVGDHAPIKLVPKYFRMVWSERVEVIAADNRDKGSLYTVRIRSIFVINETEMY